VLDTQVDPLLNQTFEPLVSGDLAPKVLHPFSADVLGAALHPSCIADLPVEFCDFRLHRQEKFLYTLGALDQWEWEIRVVDLQDGAEGDETPVCVGGRGAAPPPYSGGSTGYRLMLKRQKMGEQMFEPAQVETAIGVLAAAHPDRPASTWELLRSVLTDGGESLDRRLEQSGRLEPEKFSLREANERLAKLLQYRRFA
jgi:hypothetical protein